VQLQIPINLSLVREICHRWGVRELSVFGSAIREDFRPDSDLDLLVSFVPGASLSLFDLMAFREQLEAVAGRKVDLVEREALRNPFRRASILAHREILYAA
jgi:predicted nucleotidyltransferase